MLSSSKKSGWSKEHCSSDSSEPKKSEKGLSCPYTKSRKENKEKNGKKQMMDAREWSKDEKEQPKSSCVILKKKRLDARSYRALLGPPARISKWSDLGLKLKRENKQSQGTSYYIRAGSSAEENEDECREIREEEAIWEFSHFICERKNPHKENHEFESRDKSPLSQSGDISQQSSPDGSGHKEVEDDSESMQLECSIMKDFQRAELMESISEGRSLAGDTEKGGADRVGTLKRKRNRTDMDSDTSPMEASKEICSVTAGAVSSSPSGSETGNFIERCIVCSKRKRVDLDSHDQEFCHCNAKDTSEPEAGDGTGLTEEFHNVGQHDKTPLVLQAEANQNACVVCKLGGKLLCCYGKGCKRNFHLSCLDPPLKDVPPGVWHCFLCVKKKIELGVHSVSEQVESIWDAREVDVSDQEGMQRQKQYLVKYKDLAHVHNRWVPESQLLQDVPLLVAKFNSKNKHVRWKLEWTVPHRLLQKRLLVSTKQRDEYQRKNGTVISDCYHEWLVKWSDLGYEHVTWEFETSSFLRSTEAMKLIGDYESRREKAKRASGPSRTDKAQREMEGSFVELSKLPGEGPPGVDYHLTFVNKLRECWHKGQNAFLIYDQERFMKVILFILSLQSNVGRPFLIVSSALSVWETEFLRLAPSINVVVYSGSSDVRKSIRTVEFYEESGCVLFQVLLATPDVVVEDLEVLECLGWEALIVDECQHSRVSKYFEQMKWLPTDFRLLVASGQIKDRLADYLNLLAFLDSVGERASPDSLKVDSSDNIGKLKERLAQFVPFECKFGSSKFVEYWVPVKLSSVQLEHYCFALLSNEMSLRRSCSKNDSVGALRDILVSARKCCNHPYLLEPSLQGLLTKGLPADEYLNVGIKASGKLQLLDNILQKIRRHGLRVLVLFQSFGGSRLGDILDDFLRLRFGPESYERVDRLFRSKQKQAAINMFNSKERGRFVFLLENRACHPTVKLSSVDTIILFDSDWNPLNDLRALQRIHIDSQLEQLKVFRLYTSCTVEEKILCLANQDISLDRNIQNLNHSTCQMLLIWGASYLFSKLDEFHGDSTLASDLNILSDEPFLNAVVDEWLIHLPQNSVNSKESISLFISKVEQTGATYSRDLPLLGETEMQMRDEEPPHGFWTKLLQGRYPLWRYLSRSSHRVRKIVQYFDESPRKSDAECDEVIKKRKKVANGVIDPISLKPWLEKRKVLSRGEEGASGDPAGNGSRSLPRSEVVSDKNIVCFTANEISDVSETHLVESEERRKLRDVQKSLHLLLRPEISKLCEILKLPGYIKGMATRFLEYIMNNHHVVREPVAILQAFQISVCWTAAALFNHKIDHKESLANVKQLLNFECNYEEAEIMFSELRMLKKMFHCPISTSTELKPVEDSLPRTEKLSNFLLCASSSQSMRSAQEELEGEIRDSSQHGPAKQQQATDFDKTSWSQKNNFLKGISQFKKICAKRIKKLLEKQQEELQKFDEIRQKEKAKLDKELTLELAVIRTLHKHNSMRLDKMKKAEQDHAKKIEEHNQHWEVLKKNLEALQLVSRNKEEQMKAHWLEQAECGKLVETFAKLPLPDSGFRLENKVAGELGVTQISGPPSEKSNPNTTFPTKPGEVLPSSEAKTIPNETAEGCGMDAILFMQPNVEEDRVDATVAWQSDGDRNRLDIMHDVQPNREDDRMDVTVAMQSGGDTNMLDTTLDMQPTRGDDQVDATRLDMQSNGDDGTIAMHPVVVDSGVNTTVAKLPQRDKNGMDSTYGMESCMEDNAMDATASERVILAGDEQQHNRADNNSNSVDFCSFEPTQIEVESHSLAQPHVTAAQDNSLPLDEILHVEHCEPPTSAALQDEAAPSCEMQITHELVQIPSNQPADYVPSEEPNHDTSVMEPVQQLPLLVSIVPPSTACDQQHESEPGSFHETTNEGHTSCQWAQPLDPLMDNPAETNFHSDSTPAVEDQYEPSHSLPQPISPFPRHLPVERPSVGSRALVSDTSMATIPESSNCPQMVHLIGSSTNASVTEGVGTLQESSDHPPQPTIIATQMCQTGYSDPLQHEMERLQKEKEQTIKFHGELILQFESECSKEIEDIRRKYAALLQEAETAVVQKSVALDANYYKVCMNKMLAGAFRSKFSDQGASGAQGQQQGMPTCFVQQLFQMSLHQHAQRPAPVYNTPPAAPPLQVVHHSSALFSSNPARQHISPVVPPAGNLQIASEPRHPAPHLQRFRPSTSMSVPNLQPVPHTILCQPALGNAASTSSMIPQFASRAPTYLSGPSRYNQLLESAGGLAGFGNPPFSALELPFDVGNQPCVNPAGLLLPFPDLGPTLDAFDPFELITYGTLQGTAVRTGPEGRVHF